MTQNVVFKRWEKIPDVVKVCGEIDKISGRYAGYLASGKTEDKVKARKEWQQLSEKYWDLLWAILDAQTESFPERLTFDDEERLFIDFGYLNDSVTPRNAKFDTARSLTLKAVPGVFQYETLSDFIAECWATITRNPLPPLVCGEGLERTESMEKRLAELQAKRDEEIERIISRISNDNGGDVEKITSGLDECLMQTLKVEMRVREFREAPDEVKQGMSQDRFRYNEAEHAMMIQLSIAQKDEVEPLGLPESEIFMALHESTKTLGRKILYSRQDEEKTRARLKKGGDACLQFSQQMMRKELKNMLAKKKEYMAVPAKVARCEQSFFCPQDSEPMGYDTASRMVEDLCDLDMDMFIVPRIRMYGVPRVIFIPGQGLGTYDWGDHTILLPMFPTTSAEKSLAYALGTFRWDSDEDRILKNTYEHIKENRGKSILEMASSFYKDYFLWVTKEKKGYRILPRETHKTFLQMFAPRNKGES
ncbi:MAG: hypothetical protein LBR61_05210 [Synergistaceae bacterium]|jgi:hypothetical protein|nr:hypothetical protein [Synergistaceae bacterium]